MPEAVSPGTALPPTGTSTTVSRSAIVYQLGGRTYPMRSESRCKVCQSPYRMEIERSLIRAYSPTTVHRSLPPEAQEQVSVRNISEHSQRHLPVDQTIRQAVIDARARELGTDVESASGPLADHIVFAKVGLQQVYERLADGEIKPDVKDGIAFANLLLRVEEQAGGGIDEEIMARGFMVYLRAMRQVCTPEQIQQMSQIIQQDPTMNALLNMVERVDGHEIEATATVAGEA